MNIQKSNKLIAEFMGGKIMWKTGKHINISGYYLPYLGKNENTLTGEYEATINSYVSVSGLKYHNSWDWLMPVVEKIQNLGVSTNIHYYAGTNVNEATINSSVTFLGYKMEYDNSEFKTKMEATYTSVVKFIRWYNKQKKKK